MTKNYVKVFGLLVCMSNLFLSCQKEDISGGNNVLSVNEWIESTMRENYLWNDEIPPKKNLSLSAEPTDFFRSLLSLKDGKTYGDSHFYYSYIEKNKEYVSTRSSIDSDNSYGLEYASYQIMGENKVPLGYYWVRVLYVLPNSPAALANLKRGDWIVGFDGRNDNIKSINALLNGGGLTLTISTTNPSDPNTYVQRALTASRTVEDNPLFADKIIEIGGRKIGYQLYNHFTTGPNGYDDRTYDEQMKARFKYFADQGVNEFVLDLRYNGGGYLRSANLLASLLVPEVYKGELFSVHTDNQGKQSKRYFNSEGATTHLNLNRLYVLTSRSTASASEAVISGLKPYLPVILVGETTEGKNVGSVHYSKKEYEWALQPIVMRITNRTGSDYSSGWVADYYYDELDNSANQNATEQLLPFGDRSEFLLSKAISLITNGSLSTRSLPANEPAEPNWNMVYKSTERNNTNGVLIEPNYSRDKFWQ